MIGLAMSRVLLDEAIGRTRVVLSCLEQAAEAVGQGDAALARGALLNTSNEIGDLAALERTIGLLLMWEAR